VRVYRLQDGTIGDSSAMDRSAKSLEFRFDRLIEQELVGSSTHAFPVRALRACCKGVCSRLGWNIGRDMDERQS
jgi:hypothetical protein